MAKKCVNVEVTLKDAGGDINRMIKKFIKKVKKERIVDDYLERRRYTKPSERRRKEKMMKKENARKAERERQKKTDMKTKYRTR